jgi:hypothetical protein
LELLSAVFSLGAVVSARVDQKSAISNAKFLKTNKRSYKILCKIRIAKDLQVKTG